MRTPSKAFSKKPKPLILQLAGKSDLDQETAYTICRLINVVGWSLTDDWDWNWLNKKRRNYRSLIDFSLLKKAWEILVEKDWLSLQTVNEKDKKICTIAPLKEMINLKSLVISNNFVEDLSPLAGMTKLADLILAHNRISDLAPLRNLQLLEDLTLSANPIASMRVLEDLPRLRELHISTGQFEKFVECKRLGKLSWFGIGGDESITVRERWPEMPSLAFLDAHGIKDLRGIERFQALENLRLWNGHFCDLNMLSKLKGLTHISLTSSQPLNVAPLATLHALRNLIISSPKIEGLAALTCLPVLHQCHVTDESTCNAKDLEELRASLTPWDLEFQTSTKGVEPSLEIEVVDELAFDHHDSKASFGIRPGESNVLMLSNERDWLIRQIDEALSVTFEQETDYALPFMTGCRRSDRLILYSVEAYESARDIILAVQRILCQTSNDWIIWFQSLLREGPEAEDVADELEDFIAWIYPNKIVATKENAKILCKLIEWEG